MAVPFTKDVLLVSSPNLGGMALVSDCTVTLLDQDDCTGIWVTEDTLFRNVIVGPAGSRSMQLQSFSASLGKKVLAVDTLYDFHDILVHEDQLYLVSTGTNEVIVLDQQANEIKRHAYPGNNDSWHINCLGLWDGKVVLSAFGEFESLRGYKNHSLQQGFLIDIESGVKVWEGLSQPHTPAQYRGKYFICNSEAKQVLVKDADGNITSLQFDGYTRGLAFGDHHMYVGLSQSRNIAPGSPTDAFARIVAIDSLSFEKCAEIALPFSEIYDLRIIEHGSLLPTLMLSLNGMALKNDLSELSALNNALNFQLKQSLCELNKIRAQFERVNDHFIAGAVIKLLRWLKRDDSFGSPDINSNSASPAKRSQAKPADIA
jgi:hypothetical protein